MSAAGFFDVHCALVLQDGWAALTASDGAAFRALFPGVGDDITTEWLNELAPTVDGARNQYGLEIRTAFVPEQTTLPFIVIQYLDEPEDEAPLGYLTMSKTESGRKHGMLLRQTAQIHIMTPHPELTRCLHVSILAIMLSNRDFFVSNGYCDLEYQGGGDLQAQQDLMPEFLGAYVRTQRYTARADFDVTISTTLESHKVLVASADQVIGGTVGGVDSNT